MADESTDELCKDCGPTFTAFLERMADHNKEQMELNAKVTCPTCGKVHEYTFPYAPKATVPPASPPLADERDFCSKKVVGQDLSTIPLKHRDSASARRGLAPPPRTPQLEHGLAVATPTGLLVKNLYSTH